MSKLKQTPAVQEQVSENLDSARDCAGLDSDSVISLPIEGKVERFVDDVFGGAHHVQKVYRAGHFYVVIPYGSLATYDDDKLTRIVIASHRYGLRAEVTNYGMRGLKILLHNRKARSGRIFERHPTLEEVLRG